MLGRKNTQQSNKQEKNKNKNPCLTVGAEKEASNIHSTVIDGVSAECEALCSH